MADDKKNGRDPKGLPEAVAAKLRDWNEAHPAGQNPDPLDVAEPEADDDALELSPAEKLEECAAEPETDIGLGTRLRIRYGTILRHVTHVGWHGFDGMRFKEDASGAFSRQLAHKTAVFVDDEAIMLDCSPEEQAAIEDGRLAAEEMKKLGKVAKTWTAEQIAVYEALEKRVKAMRDVEDDRAGRISSRHTFAKSAANTSRINNMLSEAAPYLALEVDQLNRDLHAINCRSGTLRFARSAETGKWQVRRDRHRAADYISKLAEVTFDDRAGCPTFMAFLKRIMPDPDKRAFLQRYFGYCLLGITVEQCLLFFYGAGRNGKSTLVDLVVELMGDYAVSMSIDSFAGDSKRAGAEATPDLARLPGARLVAASEPEMGVKLKDALIKALTGGEVISVRRLHQDFFELKPQFKIILSGNHKPVIQDDSDGIWRRVFLVPFEVQIPEEEVDQQLPQKLRTEAAGIFGWMVRGCLDYLDGGLSVPDSIRAATAEYREESDPIGAFLRHGCHITGDANDRETPLELYQAFTIYARREGLPDFRQATFTKRLPDQTRKHFRSPDGDMRQFMKVKSGTTVYSGIRIREEYRPQSEDPGGGARTSPTSMAHDDPYGHDPY